MPLKNTISMTPLLFTCLYVWLLLYNTALLFTLRVNKSEKTFLIKTNSGFKMEKKKKDRDKNTLSRKIFQDKYFFSHKPPKFKTNYFVCSLYENK